MKSLKPLTVLSIAIALLLLSNRSLATTYYSIKSGNWSATGVWSLTSGGAATTAVPGSGDVVIIEGGFKVTINSNITCTDVQIGSLTSAGGAGTIAFSGTSTLTVLGTITVGGSANVLNTGTLTLSANRALVATNVILGGSGTNPATGTITMTNNSTLTTASLAVGTGGGTWTPGGGTVVLAATNTLPSTLFTTFNNLTINGGTTTSSLSALTVGGDLTISSGAFVLSAPSAAFTISGDFINNGTFTPNTATVTLAGAWTNNGTITPNTATVILNGNTAGGQTISGTGVNTFYNLTISDSKDIPLAGNITVTDTLSFVKGNIVTGVNAVIIPVTAIVTGAASAGYINGIEEKYIASGTTSINFEIGDAVRYTPVTIVFTGVSNSTGYITATTTGSDHPDIGTSNILSNEDVNRYWTLSNTGVSFTTYSPTFTFNNPHDEDAGVVETTFIIQRFAASAWTSPTLGTLTSTSSQATGLTSTQFGDFAIGNTATATATAISSSANPGCLGTNIKLTGLVTAGGSSIAGAVGDSVTFFDGATAIGTIKVNSSGKAVLTISTLTAGSHSVTAVFLGDNIYGTSTSSILSQSITTSATASLSSAVGTDSQTVCFNSAITPITYSTANTTGASISNLPAGIGSNYNSGTGVITITGTATLSGTFVYYVTPIGTCSGTTDSGYIIINALPTLATVATLPTCSGSTTTVNLTGLIANSTNNTIGYSINSVTQTPVTGVNADALGNASFTSSVVTAANNGQTLMITSISDNGCSQSFSSTTTLAVNGFSKWLGVNSNWNDPSNWCGSIPTSATDVQINSGTVFPDITSGTVSVHSITIASGDSLVVNNATLQVSATIINNGVLDITQGTLELNGTSSSQTIDGSAFSGKTIQNLIISNSNGVSLTATANDTLNISGVLSFGNVNNTVFNTNDNLTLLSNATNTAAVGDITNGGVNSGDTIIGKVVVERFMPAHRAWRLMGVPVSATNAPTISAAWQEGAVDVTLGERVNPFPGYGTHITGGGTHNPSGVGNSGNNGFDAGPQSTSIYYFSGTGWAIPANTSTTLITAYPGYMIFVRGDRSTNLAQATTAPATTTILRTKGRLNTGTQVLHLTGSGYHIIPNPFTSTINYSSVSNNNVNISGDYLVMDPLITGTFGVGSFVALISNGDGTFMAIPDPSIPTFNNTNPHSVDLSGNIQSGTSFMVYTDSVTSSVTFNEQDKITGTNTYLFRPSSNPTTTTQSLRTNLYASDGSGNNNLMDGVLDLYNPSYSNTVNFSEDVKKVGNPSESISLLSGGQSLTAEKRQPLTATDTIHYSIISYTHSDYTLEFIASNLGTNGLTGVIKDSYTGVSKPLNMSGTTDFGFTVNTAVPASTLATRFTVVFASSGTVLPVTFTNINAVQQSANAIAVQWQVTNEFNIKQYLVEKSTDDINFTTITTVAATGNNNTSVDYSFVDKTPASGKNYYRVESIDNNGNIEYTKTVAVNTPVINSSITVYPNPVTGGLIHLQMNNMPTGTYSVRLLNSFGQVITTADIKHILSTPSETISYDNNLATGTYQVEIISQNNSKTTISAVL